MLRPRGFRPPGMPGADWSPGQNECRFRAWLFGIGVPSGRGWHRILRSISRNPPPFRGAEPESGGHSRLMLLLYLCGRRYHSRELSLGRTLPAAGPRRRPLARMWKPESEAPGRNCLSCILWIPPNVGRIGIANRGNNAWAAWRYPHAWRPLCVFPSPCVLFFAFPWFLFYFFVQGGVRLRKNRI